MRFDDRITGNLQTYAKQATIIHIEIDPSEVNKNVEVDLAIIADAKDALKALLPRVRENNHNEWLESFRSFEKEEYDKVIRKNIAGKRKEIRMDEVVHMVSEKTKGNAIVVTDVGQNQMVSARNYKFSRSNSWVTSGGLGTMGFGLPASLGAKIGVADREVIAFIGDGGFQMTMQELGTLAQTGVAVKIIILNNRFLGMVRQWQDMFFNKRYSFTRMHNPDFVKLAAAFGIKGRQVKERKDLASATDELLASDETFLLEVMVGQEDNVFPMVPAGESISNIRLQ
ncbi:MAG: acetolactate synthase large subunit, partial [Bacteroidales bacterium]